jgi:hypothetical protein
MYAILQAFKEWRHYCHGSEHKITVYTDHKNISYFTTTRELSSRQVGYFEFLSQFNYELIHCKGTENGRADALSRRTDHEQEIPDVTAQALQYNENGNIEQVHMHAMFKVLENDPMLEEIKEYVKNHLDEEYPEDVIIEAGYPERNGKIWVPEELRKKVVKYVHEHPLHGHKGITKTVNQVLNYYDIKGLKPTVQHVVSHCNVCQQTKDGRHKPYGKLQPLPVPERPWESVTFDHITDLPPSIEPLTKVKYDSIFVVVCRLTKQAYFIPHNKSHTAEELAYTYMRMIAADHGLPKEMISDRG